MCINIYHQFIKTDENANQDENDLPNLFQSC